MKHSEKIGLLMYKYMRNELSSSQMRELLAWRNQSPKHEGAFQEATDWDNIRADLQWSYNNRQAILEKVKAANPGPWREIEEKPPVKIRLMTRVFRAAAITTFLITFVVHRYSVQSNDRPHPGTYAGLIGSSDDFALPFIRDFVRGYKAGAANLRVEEHDNGDIDYIATNNPERPDRIYDVETYRGNSFALRLPGMGSIWVNASTTVWFPAMFVRDTLRIKLTGEAYFEMTGNKPVVIEIPSTINPPSPAETGAGGQSHQPSTFITETGSFNVHAYPSDTLKVSRDAQSAAWKNRMFDYQNVPLKTILDEIARWYDVDLNYGHRISDKKYSIRLPRNAPFSEVVRVLEEQGLNIHVMRKNVYII